nr:hypothetical protein [uncultured Methanospirillum sp.]
MALPGYCAGDKFESSFANVSNTNSGETYSSGTPNLTIERDLKPIYEVKLVSPQIIKNVKTNSNILDTILKIGPGLLVGVSTPNTLYLNANIHSDEYLMKNRENSDYKEKITEHLISIVYGKDSANNSLLQSEPDYMIWFNEAYLSDDINTSLAFTREFNNLSSTAQFEDESVLRGDLKDNYVTVPYHYYRITFTSREILDDYRKDKFKSSNEEVFKDKNGVLIGIIGPEYVYLWNGLEGKERQYYVLKALYWNMGIHGETSSEPTSFFYSQANSSVTLSELDKDAIRLLYGGRLTPGMNADTMRKALNINL